MTLEEECQKERRAVAAATPNRIALLESWEQLYLLSLRNDEKALAAQIKKHVSMCSNAACERMVKDTLYGIRHTTGLADALKRVRVALDKYRVVAA